eukprot:6293610-Prymnesium_polylepis.1
MAACGRSVDPDPEVPGYTLFEVWSVRLHFVTTPDMLQTQRRRKLGGYSERRPRQPNQRQDPKVTH